MTAALDKAFAQIDAMFASQDRKRDEKRRVLAFTPIEPWLERVAYALSDKTKEFPWHAEDRVAAMPIRDVLAALYLMRRQSRRPEQRTYLFRLFRAVKRDQKLTRQCAIRFAPPKPGSGGWAVDMRTLPALHSNLKQAAE